MRSQNDVAFVDAGLRGKVTMAKPIRWDIAAVVLLGAVAVGAKAYQSDWETLAQLFGMAGVLIFLVLPARLRAVIMGGGFLAVASVAFVIMWWPMSAPLLATPALAVWLWRRRVNDQRSQDEMRRLKYERPTNATSRVSD
jgi:hypothetical protein